MRNIRARFCSVSMLRYFDTSLEDASRFFVGLQSAFIVNEFACYPVSSLKFRVSSGDALSYCHLRNTNTVNFDC